MNKIISTKSPWNQKKYIIFGAGYIAMIISLCLYIGFIYLFDAILNILFLRVLSISILIASFLVIYKSYYSFFIKSQIWSIDDNFISSPSLKIKIQISTIEKIYLGIIKKKSIFLRYGSSLAKSYYPNVPEYYQNAFVLFLPNSKMISLSLWHLENGEEIMKIIKEKCKLIIENENYYNKKLYKPFSSNRIVER